jgi:phytoene/squalene synthetase
VRPDGIEPQSGVEWLCVRECLRFSRRHRRYFLIFLILYWHSLWHWKSARAARYGFCFLQLYDDIMDGDRLTGTAPEAIAAQTIAEWETGNFSGDSSLSRLGAALDATFKKWPLLPEDNPRRDVLILLNAMRFDSRRVATRALLTRTELTSHLRTTFHHSVNLLLIASQMQTRAKSVPDLVEALAWCSVVRDLSEDLSKGLVNVPAEVMQRAQGVEGASAQLVSQDPEIRRWLDEEKVGALHHLRISATTLQSLRTHDLRAARLLGLFQRSIERYAKEKRIRFVRRIFRLPARNENLKVSSQQVSGGKLPSPTAHDETA